MTRGRIAPAIAPTDGEVDTEAAVAVGVGGHTGYYASESDLEALPEFRPVDPLNVLIGWGAGRGQGREPLASAGEASLLLSERRRFIEAHLPGYDDLPPAGQQAVLRAFERGWRAGRTFEWERAGRSNSASR